MGATKNTDLGNFLSRPTLIDTRTWTTADTNGLSGTTIEPWYLYLNNAVIKQKITNYAFLRAKLCLKFVINATPFHFGSMLVSYEPSVNAANNGERYSKIRPSGVAGFDGDLVPLSQLPGVWLYPADNAGGEMELPFFRPINWLPLTEASSTKSMGVLRYYIAAPLQFASSSGSTAVTIETFAWLEDVEISGSTAELTLQSKDEYDGPISRAASAVASVSNSLEKVPIIGKFARATTIGASAIANIASMFGFTNTPVIDDIPARIVQAGPLLASTQIGTQVNKLTVDPKQELSIDPTLHGIGPTDEMSIQHIVTKKSFLTDSTWATSDTVGTVLYNARVSPMMFNKVDVDSAGSTKAYRVYGTPMSYVGALFTHWRGDVIFDFDVICTKFHKGRLKVAWDPLGSGGTTALSENQVYNTIIDIGTNNKASLRIPYHQAYSWLRMDPDVSFLNWSSTGSSGITSMSSGPTDNGLLVVSVLTPLVSPVSPQTVTILVSVRGADNLEYANPSDAVGYTPSLPPPTFFPIQSGDIVDTVSTVVSLGDNGSKHPHRYDLNFGEQIVSLRTLLHRYTLYDTCCSSSGGGTRFHAVGKSYSRLPPMYGYDPNSTNSAVAPISGASTPFNYTPTHPITYVAMMYGGMRGSVNYSANFGTDLYPSVGDVRVDRINTTTYAAYRPGKLINSLDASTSLSSAHNFLNTTLGSFGNAGAAFTNGMTNSVITWNAPYQSGVNFTYPDPYAALEGYTLDQSKFECTFLTANLKQLTVNTTSKEFTITSYAGTGPDFTCLWWLCVPTMDYYVSNPTPV